MNGGLFDENSSFIAYAQSIYLTCMRDYARDGMHEYLVRLKVFIFVWVSVYRISTMREQQMAWWECVFCPGSSEL